MGHVVDLWTVPNPDGGRPARVRGPRWGSGSRWRARWVEPNGVEGSKVFPSKDAALAHLQQVEVDKRTGRYVTPSRVTFGQYADRWLQHQVHQREGTADTAGRRLRLGPVAAFGGVPVGKVTRADVQDMIVAETTRGLGPATVRLTYVYTRAVFAAAVEDQLIVASPCRRINLPEVLHERVHPLTVAQVQGMAAQLVDDPQQDGRAGRRLGHLHAMFLLGAVTGLRPGELRSITADRVQGDQLRVDRQLARGSNRTMRWGPLKTKASYRVVPLPPSTVGLLQAHTARFGLGPEGLLFHTRRGAPCVSRGQLAYAWEVASEGLGLPAGQGWHELRHHHASLLIAAGLSPRAVADRLGHADPSETLATYAHLWPSDQDRILDAIEAAYPDGCS